MEILSGVVQEVFMIKLVVGLLLIGATLYSEAVLAARILGGRYDHQAKTVTLKVAYQGGCVQPNFYINWTECGFDTTLQKPYLSGLLLAKNSIQSCDQDVEQELEFDLENIQCEPEVILLKATSSKVPFVIIRE